MAKMSRSKPKHWSEPEERRLKFLAKQKYRTDVIAQILGRYITSVRRKARELGLTLSKRAKAKPHKGEISRARRPV
jgi:transposase